VRVTIPPRSVPAIVLQLRAAEGGVPEDGAPVAPEPAAPADPDGAWTAERDLELLETVDRGESPYPLAADWGVPVSALRDRVRVLAGPNTIVERQAAIERLRREVGE
jgi:hypothetical protein